MSKALCVLVPDVHGRTFWKDVFDFDCDVIFLGDYLDPYGFEGINNRDAINNFTEILDYMNSHENASFLLGNHDCEYLIGTDVCNCRCDYWHFDMIREMFKENSERFSFAIERDYGGKKFLFSHAGVHPEWLKQHKDHIDTEYLKNFKYIDIDDGSADPDAVVNVKKFYSAIGDVSGMRGGYSRAGSVIWSDIREYQNTALDDRYDQQIVGHTYLKSKPIGTGQITCIDLQRIFLIDENGVLREKDFTPAEKIYI